MEKTSVFWTFVQIFAVARAFDSLQILQLRQKFQLIFSLCVRECMSMDHF
jgi:hypothetical protein